MFFLNKDSFTALRQRLSFKLFVIVFVSSLLVTLLFTGIHLIFQYRKGIAQIGRNVDFVEESYLPSIANSLYFLDENQLSLQLNGVLQLPGIEYCEIQEKSGERAFKISEGNSKSRKDIIRVMILKHKTREAEWFTVGKLIIHASFGIVYDQLWQRASILIIQSALQIFITAFLVLAIFQVMVARHLKAMARYAQSLNIENLEPELTFKRSPKEDELSQVSNAINDLRIRLKLDIVKRQEAEDALLKSEERLSNINKCFLSFGIKPLENINLLTMLCGELMGSGWALYNRLDRGMLCSVGQYNSPVGYYPVDKPDGHICYYVIKKADDETLVVTNLQESAYAQSDPTVIPYNLQTYVGRAVKLRDTCIGALCVVYQVDYVPSEADKKVVEIIASAIGVEEERSWAEEALRESEEKLARSKKMEALGMLAGGVAHDLNNVLSGVVSYPELLLLDLPQDSKLRKPIETIQETGNRAAAIVQDLITVARGVAISKEALNLNTIVKDYLLSPEFNKLEQYHRTVSTKTNLDTDLLNISGSEAHLRKAVMNLVSNAAEAVESSGNVLISTMNRYVDKPIKGYEDVNMGEYALLSVSDDGPGILPDDLARIFEPFYTKKVMGRSGTGLGLAVVWNVVQDLNGYLDVISDENGTTFDLYFPITRDEVLEKGLARPIKDYKGDGETVLVVDDVENQREIACEMLNTLGYKAKAVCSGEEAVEYLKEHTADLILLDMIMDPGINGCETYERIIKIHPNQKTVIASGFAETDDVKEAQKLGAGPYIKKPLTLEKIGIAVKDELKK